jgi:hypothetical protein
VIELVDPVQIPNATGAAQRRVVSPGLFPSSNADAMGCDGMVMRCDAAQPRAGPDGQVPDTACDRRGLQYSVPRTNLHMSPSTSLIRLASSVQVQNGVVSDPQPTWCTG